MDALKAAVLQAEEDSHMRHTPLRQAFNALKNLQLQGGGGDIREDQAKQILMKSMILEHSKKSFGGSDAINLVGNGGDDQQLGLVKHDGTCVGTLTWNNLNSHGDSFTFTLDSTQNGDIESLREISGINNPKQELKGKRSKLRMHFPWSTQFYPLHFVAGSNILTVKLCISPDKLAEALEDDLGVTADRNVATQILRESMVLNINKRGPSLQEVDYLSGAGKLELGYDMGTLTWKNNENRHQITFTLDSPRNNDILSLNEISGINNPIQGLEGKRSELIMFFPWALEHLYEPLHFRQSRYSTHGEQQLKQQLTVHLRICLHKLVKNINETFYGAGEADADGAGAADADGAGAADAAAAKGAACAVM